MSADSKASAQLAVQQVRAGGGTNLSGGLFSGVDQHQQVLTTQAPLPVNEQNQSAKGQSHGIHCAPSKLVHALYCDVFSTHLS